MFGTKSVCLTFSIFLFVFFGEMYVPFLDGSFIYGYFEFGGMVLSGMEENKKSGGGDVRAEALAWDDEWDKA